MILLTRVDSRLVHGQVLEGWVPHLHVERILVADDQAAGDATATAAMAIAAPDDLEIVVAPLAKAEYRRMSEDKVRTLVLVRDVPGAVQARELGLPQGPLQLGNVHAGPGRVAKTRSVFLSADDVTALDGLATGGMLVTAQATPGEAAVPLAKLR